MINDKIIYYIWYHLVPSRPASSCVVVFDHVCSFSSEVTLLELGLCPNLLRCAGHLLSRIQSLDEVLLHRHSICGVQGHLMTRFYRFGLWRHNRIHPKWSPKNKQNHAQKSEYGVHVIWVIKFWHAWPPYPTKGTNHRSSPKDKSSEVPKGSQNAFHSADPSLSWISVHSVPFLPGFSLSKYDVKRTLSKTCLLASQMCWFKKWNIFKFHMVSTHALKISR